MIDPDVKFHISHLNIYSYIVYLLRKELKLDFSDYVKCKFNQALF
jgi:hypothetical protein